MKDRNRTGAGRGRRFPDAPATSEPVFGAGPVRELAAAAPEAVRMLYVRRDARGRFAAEISRVAAAGGEVRDADEQSLARLAGSEALHQGIVALISPPRPLALEDVIAAQPDPILLIDGVTDPRNLGALMRTADGAGVGAVIIARDRTARLTPVAMKASAGAWVHLKIAECGNVARTLETLKEAGYWIAALAPAASTTIYDLDTSRRLVLVAGSEGEGLRDLVRRTSDYLIGIPMHGRVKSLNVAVAAAVALFEIARRRAAGPAKR
jgi:23S rRNA (guanosine2251-2'-O)-methyltransferase